MANILLLYEKDEEKVQTIKFRRIGSGESHSGKHNPKVTGSSPVPATKQKELISQEISSFFISLQNIIIR